MIVTYMNENYDCVRAVRAGNRATLNLSDGGIVEFVNVKDHAWNQFSFDSGGWEIIEPTTSLKARMDSFEAAMKEIMPTIYKK